LTRHKNRRCPNFLIIKLWNVICFEKSNTFLVPPTANVCFNLKCYLLKSTVIVIMRPAFTDNETPPPMGDSLSVQNLSFRYRTGGTSLSVLEKRLSYKKFVRKMLMKLKLEHNRFWWVMFSDRNGSGWEGPSPLLLSIQPKYRTSLLSKIPIWCLWCLPNYTLILVVIYFDFEHTFSNKI
jgi:hypothetical protein